jgi:hypothetical protein
MQDVDDNSGEYDFAPEPARAAPVMRPVSALPAPAKRVQAGDATVLADILTRLDLPPQRKGLTPQERPCDEELVRPSVLRDWVAPSVLIVIGIGLRFFEAMSPLASDEPLTFGPAIGAVAIKLVLSVGLLLGGMFLAVQVLEVCFLGPVHRTAYKLVSIAIGPGALYAILSFMGGITYGSMLGTFASVAVYGLLFWLLMRLDIKDSSICVLMTWILVTAANYVAYRTEGLMRDSWM